MQRKQLHQKARPQQIENRREVLMQHLLRTNLIMPMRLSKPLQIPFKPLLPLPLLDLLLHNTCIRTQLKALPISKPEVIIRFTFKQLDAFGFERGVEVVERFFEELREKEQGGALVKTIPFVVD
jgi:hypothetical protein